MTPAALAEQLDLIFRHYDWAMAAADGFDAERRELREQFDIDVGFDDPREAVLQIAAGETGRNLLPALLGAELRLLGAVPKTRHAAEKVDLTYQKHRRLLEQAEALARACRALLDLRIDKWLDPRAAVLGVAANGRQRDLLEHIEAGDDFQAALAALVEAGPTSATPGKVYVLPSSASEDIQRIMAKGNLRTGGGSSALAATTVVPAAAAAVAAGRALTRPVRRLVARGETTLDLNMVAAELGLTPEKARRILEQAVQVGPDDELKAKLRRLEVKAQKLGDGVLLGLIARYMMERNIALPAEGVAIKDPELAKAAARLPATFKNLQARLKHHGLKPLPPDALVSKAHRQSVTFYRHRNKAIAAGVLAPA
jgi:hypothetical protein